MAEEKRSQRHACELHVTFPTDVQSAQAMRVLQVDQEPTDRVIKTFRIVESGEAMCVRFESDELKMLRVAVSSFCDYLAVVLKTMQEFGVDDDSGASSA